MTSLVFKFNDNLQLAKVPNWRSYLNWPDWFGDQAHDFYQTHDYPAAQHDPLIDLLTPQFDQFVDVLKRYTSVDQDELAKPTFLFMHVEPSAIVALSKQVRQAAVQPHLMPLPTYSGPAVAGRLPTQMPNLFNYFKVDFPLHLIEKESAIQALMEEIEVYLPHKKAFHVPLLQYAYLKDDPAPLTETTPAALGASQFYFDDMAIPTNLTPPNPPTGLTVLEADSWYMAHPQFVTSLHRLYPTPDVFDLASLDSFPTKLGHGTEMLGILVAKGGDGDLDGKDLCQGIAPSLTIRLVSCLTAGTVIRGNDLRVVCYNETAALLMAISVTPPGETILIELGTGGQRFPLDAQPAVYELLWIADRIGITVVEAAGNGGSILNTIEEGENTTVGDDAVEPLVPRDLRGIITRRQEDHSRTHWNAYTNAANRHRMEELAGRYNTCVDPPFANVDDFLDHYQETPSPAILVGAAFRNNAHSFDLIPESSRGTRVKVFAQGSLTLTTTTNDKLFTTIMGNTSGASAIVAGIVGLVQQQAHAKGHPVIPPASMACWLTSQTNQPVVASTDAGIVYAGIVPSCKKLLEQAGLIS